MLESNQLVKKYGSKAALDGVDIEIEIGKIYGFSEFFSKYEYIEPGIWRNIEENELYTTYQTKFGVCIDKVYLASQDWKTIVWS